MHQRDWGLVPALPPNLTNHLWASLSSSATFYGSQIQCLGRRHQGNRTPRSQFPGSSSSFLTSSLLPQLIPNLMLKGGGWLSSLSQEGHILTSVNFPGSSLAYPSLFHLAVIKTIANFLGISKNNRKEEDKQDKEVFRVNLVRSDL